MARILCAWSPTWAIDTWRRRNPTAGQRDAPSVSARRGDPPPPSSTGQGRSGLQLLPRSADFGGGGPRSGGGGAEEPPFALVAAERGTRRLTAVSLEAARLGLYPGQKATDAFALVPGLATAEAAPEAAAQALMALTHWCVRFSPAVAADPPDGLYLDITGVDHLWGGEAGLMSDLRARLGAAGIFARMAVADTPAAAWGLAHYGPDGTIAPPGAQREALGELPPAALKLDFETAAQIERLGFRRLDQLFALPRAPFAKRFGQSTLMRIDQALGRAGEALAFRRPPTPWIARLAFAEPISAPEDLARVTFDAAAKLCARLEAAGKGARRFELFFHRLDGESPSVAAGLALPGRDANRIAKLLAPKLETVDPGFGIEAASLAAYEVETLSGRQVKLEGAAQPGVEDGLSPLIDRLVNRLGEERVWRAAPVESHVPELSVVRGKPFAPAGEARPWDPEAPRPVRLFRRPEPLEAVVALTPDDPPNQFRWRGRLHRVRRAEGPERIGEEWWKREIEDVSVGHVRDYYRVEDADGARFWVFRAGLLDAAEPAKWWLHGVFG